MTASDLAILTEEQRALLTAALDRLVPPRDDLPGAGGLGGGAAIERALAGEPALRRLILDGLLAIALAAGEQGFAALDGDERDAALRAAEEAAPLAFAALVDHAYRGYYSDPRVLAAIGFAGPPQPRGHTLAPFDPALLQIQRRREPFWRKTT